MSEFHLCIWRKRRAASRLNSIEKNIIISICKDEITTLSRNQTPKIIKENHEISFAGHKGVIKTYERIRQSYFWERMKTDIENYIRENM